MKSGAQQRADRRIHPTQLGQAGPRRDNSHMEFLISISDWNRGHPIGCTVYVEDGSEHRQRGRVIAKAWADYTTSYPRIFTRVDIAGVEYAVRLEDVKDKPE